MISMLWQMIDHRYTKGHASEYLDGELDSGGRERIERHTSVCPQCRALLSSLRRLITELPGLSSPAPARVADRALERLRGGA